MTTPSNKRNLNQLSVPKFTEEQLQFFGDIINILQQDRLSLDPGSTEYSLYQLQYISLKSKEEEYEWLIAAHNAILSAERAERIEGKNYSPQDELEGDIDSSLSPDFSNFHSLI